MNLTEFMDRVINEGIEGAKKDYVGPANTLKLMGATEGFEECRGKSVLELTRLLADARLACDQARVLYNDKCWYFACYSAEIEWVCNCVSAALQNIGLPVIITPTARGVFQAARILGIRTEVENKD